MFSTIFIKHTNLAGKYGFNPLGEEDMNPFGVDLWVLERCNVGECLNPKMIFKMLFTLTIALKLSLYFKVFCLLKVFLPEVFNVSAGKEGLLSFVLKKSFV